MAVERIHTLYAVQLHTDAMESAVLIGGITQQQLPTGTEVRSDPTSGDPYPRHQAVVAQKPTAGFTTMHLARSLDAIGVAGIKIKSATNPGLRLFAQKYNEGEMPASGSVHKRYTIREGLLLPRRLTCGHQEDATIQYEALVTYDGTNAPIVPNDDVALPTGLVDDQRFTLAKVTVGGVLLPQLTGVDVDFGLGAVTTGSNSDVWDTHSSVRTVRPMLTFRGIDADWFKSDVIPLLGKAGTHANTSIYFRKRASDGATFVADGTAEHILFTACGLAYLDQLFDCRTNEAGEPAVMMPLRYDGTNYPLVCDTTSTIA